MINKELLSAVYPIDETTETYVGIQESTGRVMWFGKEYNDCRSEIDIHRVAHKCKEWACKEGFILISYTKPYKDVKKKGYCQIHHTQDKSRENDKSFNCDFEYESIFKACDYILKELSNK